MFYLWTRGAPCAALSRHGDATIGPRPSHRSSRRGVSRIPDTPAGRASCARSDHWQATTPGTVAGATAVALPTNSAQKCGYDSGFCDVPDHPLRVASVIATTSPFDALNFSESTAVVYEL